MSNIATTILVVEDDDNIAELLCFLLEREAEEIVRAADGMKAQEIIETSPPPNLVLLDVMLPYVDGFQLLEQIRRKEAWRDVPVLMLTSKSLENDIVRALDAGANDYIVKPFQPAELLARVKRYLDD
ncbi:MAG: response regulator [SAR324 cluster bacterium]|nr:response regulator [SAR324 cluster bacterium]